MPEPPEPPSTARDQGWLELGRALHDLRVSREWTQSDLAKRTGVPLATLSAYERAARRAPLDALVTICDAFDLLVTEFLDGVYPFGRRDKGDPPAVGAGPAQ